MVHTPPPPRPAPSRKISLWCAEVKTESDLIGPGAAPGTVPSDLEQATGLERLEILGKMEGVDIFGMEPLDASRRGLCPVVACQGRRNSS